MTTCDSVFNFIESGRGSVPEYSLGGYDAFHELCEHVSVSSPEFHPTRRKNGDQIHELSFPVEIDDVKSEDNADQV